jgi:hypothetical protein
MPSLRRRFLGVALLPLLILSGLIGPGGWFCADGSRCEPLFAPACCCACGEAGVPADACCSEDSGPLQAATLGSACGCYYDTGPGLSAAVLRAPETLEPLVALATVAPSPHRPVAPSLLCSVTPVVAIKPPRQPSSPRHTRGPPAA